VLSIIFRTMGLMYVLELEPNSRRAFETRSERHLHDSVPLFQWIRFLFFLNILQFVPDRRRTRISVVVKSHPGRFGVEFFELHVFLDACTKEQFDQ
jgi:hypothetical protein